MKKVYSSDNFLLVGSLRQVLESHYVECFTRNEYLIGGAGELPPTECWPELWIKEDFQLDKALALIEAFLESSRQVPAGPWTCPACGERLEGQFGTCWHCGTDRPEHHVE